MKKYKTNFPINGNPYDYYCGDNNYNQDVYPKKGYCDFKKQPMMPRGGTPIQMPNSCKDKDEEKDRKYMKEMYPEICKKIQQLVDEECDRMEYDGSYMYDEYPDREAVEMITDKIYDQLDVEDKMAMEEMEVEVSQRRYRGLRDLVKIVLLNEMFNRRRRRYRRRYYPYNYYDRYYNPYDYGYGYDDYYYGYYF